MSVHKTSETLMRRERPYEDGRLSAQGWRLIVKAAETLLGSPKSTSGTVAKDQGEWGFDSLEDFLADVNSERSRLLIWFERERYLKLTSSFGFTWTLEKATKKEIVSFEAEADNIIKTHWIASPPKLPQKMALFIGHGRAPDWRDLKDHLSDKHKIQVEAYETGSRAGHAIRDVLEEMMRKSSLAVLVHTPEDEQADGTFNSRPNVIHETGLFQGKLGFTRAIVLLKSGTKEFSNLSGIQQIRFTDIRETYGEVLAWIRREQNAAE